MQQLRAWIANVKRWSWVRCRRVSSMAERLCVAGANDVDAHESSVGYDAQLAAHIAHHLSTLLLHLPLSLGMQVSRRPGKS